MKQYQPPKSSRHLSWRTLGIGIAFSLVAHLVGALVFNASGTTDRPSPPRPPLVTFLSPTANAPSIREFRDSIAIRDPSASSLPNPSGFSSITILRNPKVITFIESRRDNPQFLPLPKLDPFDLQLVREPPLGELLAQHSSKPVAQPVAVGEEAPVPFVIQESSIAFAGDLRSRRLLSLANIPLVRFPAPPLPTVVRVAVSPIGGVRFAVVEHGSGSDEKDARALDIVRRWRFEALPESTDDQWGTVSIYWAAALTPSPPPATTVTNPPGASPIPTEEGTK